MTTYHARNITTGTRSPAFPFATLACLWAYARPGNWVIEDSTGLVIA